MFIGKSISGACRRNAGRQREQVRQAGRAEEPPARARQSTAASRRAHQ